MISRRKFISKVAKTTALSPVLLKCTAQQDVYNSNAPIIISTWESKEANNTAIAHVTKQPTDILTAIEYGINLVEGDPDNTSVGYGGMPDRNGEVTLDSCIMDHEGNAGAVTYLKNIKYPVSVARKVMEETPHVILSGQGAFEFAINKGFKKENLITEKSKKALEEWLMESKYEPVINIERHDTIGMLGMAENGNLSGACSTSGLAFKIAGRVGDSPIIGAGLYVDNEIGAATATGLGEFVLKSCSSFLVVELMRQGKSPEMACKMAIERVVKKYGAEDFQIGLIAINKAGQTGGYSIHEGFNYTLSDNNSSKIIDSNSYFS